MKIIYKTKKTGWMKYRAVGLVWKRGKFHVIEGSGRTPYYASLSFANFRSLA